VDPATLKERVAREARRLGFARIGFAEAGVCRDREHLLRWLAEGRHGTMSWMAREPDRRSDPGSLLPGARTVIALLSGYLTPPGDPPSPWIGRISRYAWGRDYHAVLGRRARKLARFLRGAAPGARVACAVDSRPVLEKEWAERAGLGWIGKHSNLITEDRGSWFFLTELVTDVAIPADPARARDRCGRCTECIDACPTRAIVAPRVVDARRCISYLTIECRDAIPRELRPLVGEWIFGCDVCQEVCPWNRFAVPVEEPQFARDEGRFGGDLAGFLELGPEEFLARFRGSPVRRAGRDGFLRNVCVALGNRGDAADAAPLARALREDPSPLVRAHAAWALGRIGGAAAARALAACLARETDGSVREEARLARNGAGPRGPAPSGRRDSRATPTSSPSPGRS
jgi:epoxyqueuosine reductase